MKHFPIFCFIAVISQFYAIDETIGANVAETIGKTESVKTAKTFDEIIGVPIGGETFRLETKDLCISLKDDLSGLQYHIGFIDEADENASWPYISLGEIEYEKVTSADFKLVRFTKIAWQEGLESIECELDHPYFPLTVKVVFTAYSNTGVISQSVTIENTGASAVRIKNMPAMNAFLESGNYVYHYLTTEWGRERILQSRPLAPEGFSIESTYGRSSFRFSPWICLNNTDNNSFYMAQFAWSGNWSLQLSGNKGDGVEMSFSEYFDNGFLQLMPGQTVRMPEGIFTLARSAMDEAANNLHHYQKDYVLPAPPKGMFMPVQFNSWYPLRHSISKDNLMPYIDKAAELGCEVFILDAGWFVKKNWDTEVGNWETNREKFPGGLGGVSAYVRKKGMKFGVWFEIENVADSARVLLEHPEWCLQYDGKPVRKDGRSQLDFSKPEVFAWAMRQFDNIYRESGGLDWVKLDYNISIGSNFENDEGVKTGISLLYHIFSYYNWMDSLRSKYPGLFVESCASGALRLDMGILRHCHAAYVSDETSPNPSLGMTWSATMEFLPIARNHWVVGHGTNIPYIDNSWSEAGYLDFMFKVPMNGQWGISSLITEWSPELQQIAKQNVSLFKRIRSVIAEADCYHLTPQTDFYNPEDWAVFQYVADNQEKSVIMAYRTQGGDKQFIARLKGLDADKKYHVSSDGKSLGIFSGAKLSQDGLVITLDEEFRACAIELAAQ
ncbi:MAG: alpha-galactosidase [Tannerella sp.]|jgi:alpha-galactosidase|nr:alpha-galactosidase [Tannerella sp.]